MNITPLDAIRLATQLDDAFMAVAQRLYYKGRSDRTAGVAPGDDDLFRSEIRWALQTGTDWFKSKD